MLTAEQVAARWQCSSEHVARLGREGKLPTVKLGRWRRWRLVDVEAFEAGGGAE